MFSSPVRWQKSTRSRDHVHLAHGRGAKGRLCPMNHQGLTSYWSLFNQRLLIFVLSGVRLWSHYVFSVGTPVGKMKDLIPDLAQTSKSKSEQEAFFKCLHCIKKQKTQKVCGGGGFTFVLRSIWQYSATVERKLRSWNSDVLKNKIMKLKWFSVHREKNFQLKKPVEFQEIFTPGKKSRFAYFDCHTRIKGKVHVW